MPTLLHHMFTDVYLVVRCARPTPDDEFDRHVATAAKLPGHKRAVLVYFTEDGPFTGFDARRRDKLSRAGLLTLPHALLTGAEQARAFATAMRWRGTNAQAFAREELQQACLFLEVSRALQPELHKAIASMSAQLSPPRGP